MFRIRFEGLITHANLDGQQVAVLYHEAMHTTLVSVSDNELITAYNMGEELHGDRVKCYRLHGLLRLQGLEPGPVRRYLTPLPSVQAVTGGQNVHPDVINRRTDTTPFRAFVDLTGGTLSIEDWFEPQVTFNGASLCCLPRAIVYEAAPTDPIVRLHLDHTDPAMGDGYLDLRPYAEITISNREIAEEPRPEQYHTYRNFFSDPQFIHVPQESSDFKCAYGAAEAARARCRVTGTLSVQCSNTQFP